MVLDLAKRPRGSRAPHRLPTRASTLSQIIAAMSLPPNALTCRMPVGDVTLISVRYGPITSMPTKISPRCLQLRPEPGTDLLVPLGQLGRLRRTADMHVGARLALRRHAIDGTRHLAVDQDDALVAAPHLGPVLLHHERLAKHRLEQLDQRIEVGITRLDAEHRRAAVAVERLDDDVLVAAPGTRARLPGCASPSSAASGPGTPAPTPSPVRCARAPDR